MSFYSNLFEELTAAEVEGGFASRWHEAHRRAKEQADRPWVPSPIVRMVPPSLYVHIRIVAAVIDAIFDFDCMGDPGPNYFEGAVAKP